MKKLYVLNMKTISPLLLELNTIFLFFTLKKNRNSIGKNVLCNRRRAVQKLKEVAVTLYYLFSRRTAQYSCDIPALKYKFLNGNDSLYLLYLMLQYRFSNTRLPETYERNCKMLNIMLVLIIELLNLFKLYNKS